MTYLHTTFKEELVSENFELRNFSYFGKTDTIIEMGCLMINYTFKKKLLSLKSISRFKVKLKLIPTSNRLLDICIAMNIYL